jgi:hypothetical protein
MLQELHYYMLLTYYHNTDYHHTSYQIKTPASWPLSSRNSAIFYPSNIMPAPPNSQSECSNQKLEQYTHVFHELPSDQLVHSLLPLAQFAFNAWPNTTTKKAPFELIMGHIPQVHQTFRVTMSPPLNDNLALITQARKDAADTLHKLQVLELPSNFVPYCVGDHVWLEGKNLNTTHPSAKLVPRRYGPFLITSVVSRTSFWLKLPPIWHIHNVFHGTLFTPYKETALNGHHYQEPTPDLVDASLNGKSNKFWAQERVTSNSNT